MAAAAVLLLVGGSQPAAHALQSGDGSMNPWGIGLVVDEPAGVRSVGAITLCTRSARAVVVENVSFAQTTGVAIKQWSIRSGRWEGLGSSTRSLSEEGFPTRPAQVKARCAEVDEGLVRPEEMALTVTGTGIDVSRGSALLVSYREGARTGQLAIPFDVTLCPPAMTRSCTEG